MTAKIYCQDNILVRSREKTKADIHVWFIHGFGESGFSFYEALDQKALKLYTLYIPDLAGFGVSPLPPRPHTLKNSAKAVKKLIKKFSAGKKVVLVCHSLGGIIGIFLSKWLKEQVIGFVNIEGNFTDADTFYSGVAAKSKNSKRYQEKMLQRLTKLSITHKRRISFRRYLASFQFANSEALKAWGMSGVNETGDQDAGHAFLNVSCPKVYFYSLKNCPSKTKSFLKKYQIPTVVFRRSGHWPMIDETTRCYQEIAKFIQDS